MKVTSFEISNKLDEIGFIKITDKLYDLGRGKLLDDLFEDDYTGETIATYELAK